MVYTIKKRNIEVGSIILLLLLLNQLLPSIWFCATISKRCLSSVSVATGLGKSQKPLSDHMPTLRILKVHTYTVGHEVVVMCDIFVFNSIQFGVKDNSGLIWIPLKHDPLT